MLPGAFVDLWISSSALLTLLTVYLLLSRERETFSTDEPKTWGCEPGGALERACTYCEGPVVCVSPQLRSGDVIMLVLEISPGGSICSKETSKWCKSRATLARELIHQHAAGLPTAALWLAHTLVQKAYRDASDLNGGACRKPVLHRHALNRGISGTQSFYFYEAPN